MVEVEFRAKTYDVDGYRHVHNAVYIRWLEDLRTAMLDKFYPFERFLAAGIGPVLTKTMVEYRRAVKLGERPIGRMWVLSTGRVRIGLAAEIRLGGVICAYAEQELAIIDIASGRPLRVPQAFLDAMPGASGLPASAG